MRSNVQSLVLWYVVTLLVLSLVFPGRIKPEAIRESITKDVGTQDNAEETSVRREFKESDVPTDLSAKRDKREAEAKAKAERGRMVALSPMPAFAQDRKGLTLEEVINLIREGDSPDRISQLIEKNGVAFELDERALRQLRQAGASQAVLSSVKKMSARYAEEQQQKRRLEETKRREEETARQAETERKPKAERERREAEAREKFERDRKKSERKAEAKAERDRPEAELRAKAEWERLRLESKQKMKPALPLHLEAEQKRNFAEKAKKANKETAQDHPAKFKSEEAEPQRESTKAIRDRDYAAGLKGKEDLAAKIDPSSNKASGNILKDAGRGIRSTLSSSIDEFLRNLDLGNFVFNCPDNMRVRQTYTVAALLSSTKSPEELESLISKYGKTETAKIRISDGMEAHLEGLNFRITALTPTFQAISKEETNEWSWEVMPLEKGQQKLHLSVSVYIVANNRADPHAIKTFERIITVQITAFEVVAAFVGNNWQWLIGTLIVPVVVFFWQKRKKISRRR